MPVLGTNQVLSFSQLEALWVEAGGPSWAAPIMAAVSQAESGGNIGDVNTNYATDPGGSWGLWQINAYWHPGYSTSQLSTDPLYNAQAAVAVFNSQGLNAWSTYKSGAYEQYLQGALQSGASAFAPVTPTPSLSLPAAPSGTTSLSGPSSWPAAVRVLAVVAGVLLLVVVGFAQARR